MQRSDVNQWLIDECASILSSSSLVSLDSPSAHVDIAQSRDGDGATYPFVAIQPIAAETVTRGVGNGDLAVSSTTYSNGTLDQITYVRQVDYDVEINVVTDDDAKLRDDLLDDVTDHFARLARLDGQETGGGLPADVDGLDVGEATPTGRPDEFVRADGLPLTIPYDHHVVKDNPTVADTVNVDVDVGDDDADVSESSDADAFDETL